MRLKFHSRTFGKSVRYYINKRSLQLMLLYACFFRKYINPSLIIHCVLYRPKGYGYIN